MGPLGRFASHVRGQLVGYIALFVALGGVSYAQVRDNSVIAKHIATGAVGTSELRDGGVRPQDLGFALDSTGPFDAKPLSIEPRTPTAIAKLRTPALSPRRPGNLIVLGSVQISDKVVDDGSPGNRLSLSIDHDGRSHPVGAVTLDEGATTVIPVSYITAIPRRPAPNGSTLTLRISGESGTLNVDAGEMNIITIRRTADE